MKANGIQLLNMMFNFFALATKQRNFFKLYISFPCEDAERKMFKYKRLLLEESTDVILSIRNLILC